MPMKEGTRWILLAGLGLIALSAVLYSAHYLIFHDEHHLLIFLVGDLAFVPLEVLIVTLVIDRLLASRERKARREKMNMLFGAFFTTMGTPLLATFSRADPGIRAIRDRLVIGSDWEGSRFREVRDCLKAHDCGVAPDLIDLPALAGLLSTREDFLLRIIENPAIFEHEDFTDLILALDHLVEELKARSDLSDLPLSDRRHLAGDIQRVYARLVPEWLNYMEYLKGHYPYLFSLAMRTNPFDPSASAVVGE
jgi:hypothetical protein